MQKNVFGKELFVLWISLATLVLAALNLNASLERLVERYKELEKE